MQGQIYMRFSTCLSFGALSPVAGLGLGLDDPGFWWNYEFDKFVMLLQKKRYKVFCFSML